MLNATPVEDKTIVQSYLREIFENSSLIANFLGNLENYDVQVIAPPTHVINLVSQLHEGGVVKSVESALVLKSRLRAKFNDSKNQLLFAEDVGFSEDDYLNSRFRQSVDLIETSHSVIIVTLKSLNLDIEEEFDLLARATNNFFSILAISDAANLSKKNVDVFTTDVLCNLTEVYISCFDKESYMIIKRRDIC